MPLAHIGEIPRMDDRPHIVVVEDEVTQRDMLVHYLSRHEFRVNGAEDGATLRRLVDRDLPSLVMLDIGLPGEDGFALVRWLRERSGRIGIILVTAASCPWARRSLLMTGFMSVGSSSIGSSGSMRRVIIIPPRVFWPPCRRPPRGGGESVHGASLGA